MVSAHREHCFSSRAIHRSGYRLPLESLPWTKPEDVAVDSTNPTRSRSATNCRDQPERGRDLFASDRFASARPAAGTQTKPPEKGESAPWMSRPALCVQPRKGSCTSSCRRWSIWRTISTWSPPIEDTAAHLQMPVVIEGYAPPYDPRISVLKVTPDPGVIEVNIQPAASWDELVEQHHRALRAGAAVPPGHREVHAGRAARRHRRRQSRRDRRRRRRDDSPFLRRPDLLRSMVGYWQNHPSLSYLFSGMFIGPTSQHPRVDEARTDALYELEIAFSQIPDKGEAQRPAVAGGSHFPAICWWI